MQRTTRLHVLMFNSAGDNNGRHNLPGAPMLDTFTGIFFVLGLGMSLTRLWRPRYMLLLAWMVILLQPAIWSIEFEAPQALRAILVTPAVALLAALPLGALWATAEGQAGIQPEGETSGGTGPTWRRRLVRLSSKPWRYLVSGAVALTILFFLAQVAHLNFQTYFDKQLKSGDVWAAYSTAPTLVADEIERLGPDAHYLMSSTFVGQPTLEFVDPSVGSGSQYLPRLGTGRAYPFRPDHGHLLGSRIRGLHPMAPYPLPRGRVPHVYAAGRLRLCRALRADHLT